MDQDRGRPNIVWQKITCVITGWFAGAHVIIITSGTPNHLQLLCNIHGIYLQNLAADSASQPGEPRVDIPGLYYHSEVVRKMQVKTDTLEN